MTLDNELEFERLLNHGAKVQEAPAAASQVVFLSPGLFGSPVMLPSVAIVHPLASVDVFLQAPKLGAGALRSLLSEFNTEFA